MLKETKDKIYFTNSYGQTITFNKIGLSLLKTRSIKHVFPEVREIVERLYTRQTQDKYRIVNSLSISLELRVDTKIINEILKEMEELKILAKPASKVIEVDADIVVEPDSINQLYYIMNKTQ